MSHDHPYLAKKLSLTHVMNLHTGHTFRAIDYVERDYHLLMNQREALQQAIEQKAPFLVCLNCCNPVRLLSRKIKAESADGAKKNIFYFEHDRSNASCLWSEKEERLSEAHINALKFHGARESEEHKRLKQILRCSIEADSLFGASYIEEAWRSLVPGEPCRYPDVRADFNGLSIAFEIQLSTTYLNVIVGRQEFYRQQGGMLCWILQEYDSKDARLTMQDVFHHNNRNVLIASEQTLQESLKRKKLVLKCIWQQPKILNGKISYIQESKNITFSELTLEQETQKVFFYDVDAEELRLKRQLQQEAEEAQRRHGEALLREDVEHYWLNKRETFVEPNEIEVRLTQYGIPFPRNRDDRALLDKILNSLYSAKHNRPVGWNFKTILDIGQHIYDRYKPFLWVFLLMLNRFSSSDVKKEFSESSNWQNKKNIYGAAWEYEKIDFAPNRQFDSLLCFLFPEISNDLAQKPKPLNNIKRTLNSTQT